MSDPRQSIEIASDAASRLAVGALRNGFTMKALHRYEDLAGNPVLWRIRCKDQDGRKWIRPMHWTGMTYKLGDPARPAAGYPLYRLPNLASIEKSNLVVVVEGENKADALAALDLPATTSGACTSANRTDWSPLRGRNCLIWPDNDAAGRKYAEEVTALLRVLNCSIEIIDVAHLGLPEKGDAVDWLALHPNANAEDVLRLPRISPNQDQNEAGHRPRLILSRGSEVKPIPIDWLWNGWLAAGKLHLIGGAPGTGKTTLAAALAGIVTRGGRWPDGSRAEPGCAVFWSGEDDNADTLNPRLRAAGANMEKVFIIEGVRDYNEVHPFDPAHDMDALRDTLASVPNVRLIVIDPVVSAVTGDSHKNAEVRRGLQPLVDLAGRLRCALLGVTHFSKGTSGRDPVERITGSLAFGALARLVMVTAKQDAKEDLPERRVLLRAKSNIGPDGGGFVYQLQQNELPGYSDISASSVHWGEPIDGTARELLAEAEGSNESRTNDTDGFLRALLVNGPVPAKDIYNDAVGAGYSRDAMKRSRKRIRAKIAKNGMAGGWIWWLEASEESSNRSEEREGSTSHSPLPSLPSQSSSPSLSPTEVATEMLAV